MDSNIFRAGMKARKEATTKEDEALRKMLELSKRYISILNEEEFMREEQASRAKKELEEMKKVLKAKGVTLNFSIEPEESNVVQQKTIQNEWLQFLMQLGLFGLDKFKPYQVTNGTLAFSEENDIEYMRFIRYKGLPYIEENLLKGFSEQDTEEQRTKKAKIMKQITRAMGMFTEVNIGPNTNDIKKSMTTYEWKKLVGRAARILLKRQKETFEITESQNESAREQFEEKLKIESTNEAQEKSDAVFADVKKFLADQRSVMDMNSEKQPKEIRKKTERLQTAIDRVFRESDVVNQTEMLRAFRIEGNINRLLGDYSMNMFSFEETLKVIDAYLATVEKSKDNEQALKRTNIGTFVKMAEEAKGGRKAFIAKSVANPEDVAR